MARAFGGSLPSPFAPGQQLSGPLPSPFAVGANNTCFSNQPQAIQTNVTFGSANSCENMEMSDAPNNSFGSSNTFIPGQFTGYGGGQSTSCFGGTSIFGSSGSNNNNNISFGSGQTTVFGSSSSNLSQVNGNGWQNTCNSSTAVSPFATNIGSIFGQSQPMPSQPQGIKFGPTGQDSFGGSTTIKFGPTGQGSNNDKMKFGQRALEDPVPVEQPVTELSDIPPEIRAAYDSPAFEKYNVPVIAPPDVCCR